MLFKMGRLLGLVKVQPVTTNESDTPAAGLQTNNQITALERLQQLRDKGVLTEQEFERQKNKILM